MAIIISNATATPSQLPNGATTSVKITFDGQSIGASGVNVAVVFTIAPFPALNINGSQTANGGFTFNSVSKNFSQTLNIQNNNIPPSPVFLNGTVTINGTAPDGSTDSSVAVLVYQ